MKGPRGWPALAAVALIVGTACSPADRAGAADEDAAAAATPAAVSALGRLEPGDGVVDVGSSAGERLLRLEVREGDDVAAGDLLAVLDSHPEREAEVASRRAELAEAQLEVVRTRELGPRQLAAAEAEARLLEAQLAFEQSEAKRTEELHAAKVDSRQTQERQATAVERAVEGLAKAQADLDRLREQLVLDAHAAELAVEASRAALGLAEARLARAEIRAPIDGRILKVFAWPGEALTEGPILRLGDISRMYAVAEVFETDLRHVAPGQRATITSPALAGPISGRVERVGQLIYRNRLSDVDPSAETDLRIVEVRVLLDDPAAAARLVHHQVEVSIATR